jgi:hypothetical protein
MHILKILKPIRMNSEIVQPGQMVKVIDGRGLIEKGHARRLTTDENRAILDGYVQYARDLFLEEPEKKTISKERKTIVQERLL